MRALSGQVNRVELVHGCDDAVGDLLVGIGLRAARILTECQVVLEVACSLHQLGAARASIERARAIALVWLQHGVEHVSRAVVRLALDAPGGVDELRVVLAALKRGAGEDCGGQLIGANLKAVALGIQVGFSAAVGDAVAQAAYVLLEVGGGELSEGAAAYKDVEPHAPALFLEKVQRKVLALLLGALTQRRNLGGHGNPACEPAALGAVRLVGAGENKARGGFAWVRRDGSHLRGRPFHERLLGHGGEGIDVLEVDDAASGLGGGPVVRAQVVDERAGIVCVMRAVDARKLGLLS